MEPEGAFLNQFMFAYFKHQGTNLPENDDKMIGNLFDQRDRYGDEIVSLENVGDPKHDELW